jgi:hypothetical protein
MPLFDTRDLGPVVLETLPADDGVINGSGMNYWQAAIEDVRPAGADKGKGAKIPHPIIRLRQRKSARSLYRHAGGHLPGLCAAAFRPEKRHA